MTDPGLRASDADRERVVAALQRHTAAGRLTLEEFGQRIDRAFAAVTNGDLAAVTRDLPALVDAEPAAPVPNGAAPTDGGAVAVQTAPVMVAAPAPPRPLPQKSNSMSLLYVWILLFGFVGTQLAWTLRPFFGDPGRPFALFRHIEGTFYADILQTIARLFQGG